MGRVAGALRSRLRKSKSFDPISAMNVAVPTIANAVRRHFDATGPSRAIRWAGVDARARGMLPAHALKGALKLTARELINVAVNDGIIEIVTHNRFQKSHSKIRRCHSLFFSSFL